MQDRQPTYPGRVKLIPVEGLANTYDLIRADVPRIEGTPLNKKTLLEDRVARLLGLDARSGTPSQAFEVLSSQAQVTLPVVEGSADHKYSLGFAVDELCANWSDDQIGFVKVRDIAGLMPSGTNAACLVHKLNSNNIAMLAIASSGVFSLKRKHQSIWYDWTPWSPNTTTLYDESKECSYDRSMRLSKEEVDRLNVLEIVFREYNDDHTAYTWLAVPFQASKGELEPLFTDSGEDVYLEKTILGKTYSLWLMGSYSSGWISNVYQDDIMANEAHLYFK